MSKKLLAILLSAVMIIGLTACGGGGNNGGDTESTKVYKTYLSTEVSSLNLLDNVDINVETPAAYCQSFLWRKYPNEEGNGYIWINDLAAEEPVQVDANNWQIKLRQDATWQDGSPINADTWMFTFEQALNPKMAPRMSTFLADNLITIVNATEYSLQGTEGHVASMDFSEVGIKKVDDYTIQITTEGENSAEDVMGHFYYRDNTPINEELWKECLSDDGLTTTYGSDLDHFIGCGPYTFTTWEYDSMHVYTKREDHWLADYFNYDSVEVRIVPEMNSQVELFEKGEIYSLTPDANTIDTYLDDPRMTVYGSTSVTHIDINCKNPTNPITASVNYRKAIYHSIDRETVAATIFGHMEPSGTYVNDQAGMLSESGVIYRESEYGKAVTDEVSAWGPYGYNPDMALDYLNKALEECGVTDDQLPINIKYAVDESDKSWKAFGEYLKEQWKTIFQGKLELEIVPYAGMSATDFKNTGDDKWDLSPNDWTRGASRKYPYTCFYYYTSSYSGSPNNFHPEEFDEQYAYCESIKDGDYDTLLAETQKLEEIYLEYVVQCPVYQTVNYQLFADCLELKVKTYIPGFGWGAEYGDIVDTET
ncbi:MAG: peptide ABC transporter substrate-binding protein [Eubacterium sp.]|jgi:oligopeptide transport system substrate-binding protein